MTGGWLSDRRGSVAVFTALGFTVLLGAAALGIDIGAMVVARRKAQGAVDIAATLAAANPALADVLARRSLSDNGYGANATITVQAGTYAGDSKVPVDQRFVVGASPASAVRVAMQTATPTFFAPAIGLGREAAIGVKGIAASAQFASFTIGSGLASLDAGIANAILGAMLGKPISLSVMDYNALASTRIDAFRVLDALAPTLNLQAGNYTDIVAANATVGQIAAALQVASNGVVDGSGAASALAQITSALRGGGTPVHVGQVIDLGDAAALTPGAGTKGPMISAMDALSDAISLGNGQRQVSVDLGPAIPGLLRTQITLGIGEQKQSSGYVQPGSANSTVMTAQTRLLIESTIALPLGLGSVTLPVYLQIAMSRASLRSMSCPWSSQGRRQVVLDAQPGVADLAIADIPKALIDPATQPPDLSQPATLLRVAPALIVTGRSRATLASPYMQSVTFSDDDITRHTVRTVSSSGLAQSSVASLVQSLTLSVNGLGLLAPGLVTATLGTALGVAAPSIDAVLDNTLRTIGIRVGTADLSVDGTRCDQAVLVQ
ncbi:hypothetical protein G3T14_06085 [Methylobacterium sp. BTF04]|uniref:TadG family pilus assembly protein n=1 Tax=Methylobacterium sp. BTF04 TaxID=2708300 RepID=UPI0013D8D6DD|nr:hypothetical protein [Methylobacterium sp. BTF04]